ncbi:aminotransferase class I/II-fold pyridoxal phosphate-dependent enzyme [Photorhabdus antumapuensis]|uniref:aminotransferase class I/II-fold pyridoxal phosphate-dependent enzyme n=1 Tax=Photorhabdus antumapuensis TaxID=2862867 RepID=UPI00295E5302|nr:aminotransferase class I/II-fold pyridoxal phosphate-dependent enzyme [Photorhabdus antumapuensis]MCA6222229.1 aminotransferase class I/II-fold pyridoxal phosphate-dependent enzyme [Photorhabdus antumapuensis]
MKSNICVFDTDNIHYALSMINKNSKGAVVVINKNEKLIRLLTDGDIRRALLNGYNTNSIINELPSQIEPTTASLELNPHDALRIMNAKEIDHLIILDDSNKVTSLCHRRDFSPVLLSTPHLGNEEVRFVNEAFRTNWIAPLGPNVDGFENELASMVGTKYALAVSSGTAALHLSLILLDVGYNDFVFCSSLTFAATANPIRYQHAIPVFIDSEPDSWNMSPQALESALKTYNEKGLKPKAIIVVNLYGQSANMDALVALSEKYSVPIIEDAAESLGSKYKNKHSGTFGKLGVYSFNGNKIITTSGGGMLVSDDKSLIDRARYLSTQAREPAPFYLHLEIGYNYRMSNVLAGIGRGQLRVLEDRIKRRRDIYRYYVSKLKDIQCLDWISDLDGYYSNHWLTATILNPKKTDIRPSDLINTLKENNIEARHVWNPMHRQPVFKNYEYFKHGDISISDYLFDNGICLPSGSNMTQQEHNRVIDIIREVLKK